MHIYRYFATFNDKHVGRTKDIYHNTLTVALRHGKKMVTDIYIQFDRTKIDEANRKVINHVFYN